MLISWNWLADYVALEMPAEELARRLMMAGLNHESTTKVGDDVAIDLEVTSNRPDCLGHVGIAREVGVIFGLPWRIKESKPREGRTPVAELAQVRIDCPDLCPRYTARVVRGVKIGPSPAWLVKRLATLGVAAINNVVDITNYVLFECGQPLHAFDLSRLRGRQIIVRRAKAGEKFQAINHQAYDLTGEMCVIADAETAVALGGVMGGADSEVSASTTDLLIEAAEFLPGSIRNTARALNLRSDSSYRFERGVDPEGIDWASRRACELILDLAGGELAAGVIDVGPARPPREPVVLRLNQLPRILGIDVPAEQVRAILSSLGCAAQSADASKIAVVPPSWRRDLTREIDLVEEVARIHGYDKIPEDVSVPMARSARSDEDRVLSRVRHVLTAAGFDEAYTLSAVEPGISAAYSPWTDAAPLISQMPILRGANQLRRSLIPSLLVARRTNESLSNPVIELFEIAKVYLPRPGQLPSEERLIGITSGGGYHELKGVIEALVRELHPTLTVEVAPAEHELFAKGRYARLSIAGETLGYVGEVSSAGQKKFDLRGGATAAELQLSLLTKLANLIPTYVKQPQHPAIERDLNLVVDESTQWSDVAATASAAAGPLLETIAYRDTYRHAERLGADKKSLLLTITLRDPDATLTSQAADQVCEQIVAACAKQLGAELRGVEK
ncbi:MAG: phenylalanine--tRNA ligase subunit beta [Planctomycetia bacterium]|nr:phenylalanine--tRNA ligase subunit beta [Planctomycetia bacterium]